MREADSISIRKRSQKDTLKQIYEKVSDKYGDTDYEETAGKYGDTVGEGAADRYRDTDYEGAVDKYG